jgi:hypothetical protein
MIEKQLKTTYVALGKRQKRCLRRRDEKFRCIISGRRRHPFSYSQTLRRRRQKLDPFFLSFFLFFPFFPLSIADRQAESAIAAPGSPSVRYNISQQQVEHEESSIAL